VLPRLRRHNVERESKIRESVTPPADVVGSRSRLECEFAQLEAHMHI
jgi:hypothetical protein